MTDLQPPVEQRADDQSATADAAPGDKPISDLIADMTSSVSTLVRKEVDMAVVELRDEVRRAAKAGGMLSGGALSGYLSLLFASFALAWFFDRKLPRPVAFFLVAGLHGAAAAALLNRGRQELMQVDPVPTQTVESVKENIEWAKGQTG